VTVNYSVDFSRGGSANYSPREMTSGANKLQYNLYSDASRASVWGDTTGGTSHAAGSIGLLSVLVPVSASHTIYGRIFASQNAVPGNYADSIVVTIVY
jgi:spore coat protein U-like protein